MSIMLNIAKLHAVSLAASTDQTTRYCLDGVKIETNPDPSTGSGVIYVATGRHLLIAAFDPEPVEGSNPSTSAQDAPFDKLRIIIPTEFCRQKYPKHQTHAELRADSDGYYFLDNRFRFKPLDGFYPDWRRLVPQTYNNKTAQFDPDLLAIIKKAAVLSACRRMSLSKDAGKIRVPHVRHNGNGAALVTWDDPNVFAVVMPVRVLAADGLPAWFTDKPAPERLSKAAAAA